MRDDLLTNWMDWIYIKIALNLLPELFSHKKKTVQNKYVLYFGIFLIEYFPVICFQYYIYMNHV